MRLENHTRKPEWWFWYPADHPASAAQMSSSVTARRANSRPAPSQRDRPVERPRERGGLAAALAEVARTAVTLGYFFGAMPWIALRAAGRSQVYARALVLAHAARARRLGGIELEVEGAERVPESGPFVAVFNETGLVQDLANLELMDRIRIAKMVVAAEYGWIPLFARAASAWGIVFLRRHHREEVERTLAALVATLRAGGRVCMAPQGRYSSRVCHFKRGAFLIAIRAGVPVLPIGVRGGSDILLPRSVRMRPGVLRYRIGEPISTTGLGDADAPALAARAREAVLRLRRDRPVLRRSRRALASNWRPAPALPRSASRTPSTRRSLR